MQNQNYSLVFAVSSMLTQNYLCKKIHVKKKNYLPSAVKKSTCCKNFLAGVKLKNIAGAECTRNNPLFSEAQ